MFLTTGTTSPSGFSKAKRALDARMQEILGPKFKPWPCTIFAALRDRHGAFGC